jgi:hypothetical protein
MYRKKNFIFLFFSIFILSFKTNQEYPIGNWGFFGHKKINELAIYGLPKELFLFYKENLDYIVEHSVDPDKRRYSVKNEAPCHYIDLDHYYNQQGQPYTMPLLWKDAICQFEEDSLMEHGIVPWQVQKKLHQLTEAFLTKNKQRVLQISAELGHYIGDAHVPLHTCSNYNGQKTGQKGIHGLWESRLPEIHFDEYRFFPQPAQYIENPAQRIWQSVYESHAAVDSVLHFEKKLQQTISSAQQKTFEYRGNTETSTYSQLYAKKYHQSLNGQVERQMKKAIACISDFWYTAWINAGQPNLSKWKENSWKEKLPPAASEKIREHD